MTHHCNLLPSPSLSIRSFPGKNSTLNKLLINCFCRKSLSLSPTVFNLSSLWLSTFLNFQRIVEKKFKSHCSGGVVSWEVFAIINTDATNRAMVKILIASFNFQPHAKLFWNTYALNFYFLGNPQRGLKFFFAILQHQDRFYFPRKNFTLPYSSLV